MNYANMIEEKNLKKTFILATLASTIIGTFSSGIALHDRLHQRKTDSKQDTEIKQLKERVEKAEQEKRDLRKDGGREAAVKTAKEEEFKNSLARSGPLIRREYNMGVARLGERFADGDLIAQNQIQSHIIALQQNIIRTLEDALYTGRQPSLAELGRLFAASEAAREGTLDALHDQYERMLSMAPIKRSLCLQAPTDLGAAAHKSAATSVASSPPPSPLPPEPLFCRHSIELQKDPAKRVSLAYQPNGNSRCPACATNLSLCHGRAWAVTKEVPMTGPAALELKAKAGLNVDDVLLEERTFHLSNRFVVKCHRDNGEFACILCYRSRPKDTICDSMTSFVSHVWRAHDIGEYEAEIDIREVR